MAAPRNARPASTHEWRGAPESQDAGVGRRHAQLILQAGQLLIEDLDSVNGTVVNKQRIPSRQPKPINDGDEIRLGKLVLIFHAG